MSIVHHPSSIIHHPSSIIHHQSSIINHQSSIINHRSIINHYLSSLERPTDGPTNTNYDNNTQTTDRHSCRGLPFGDDLINGLEFLNPGLLVYYNCILFLYNLIYSAQEVEPAPWRLLHVALSVPRALRRPGGGDGQEGRGGGRAQEGED